MDELTAIRQLLAEPPAPAPDVMAAARARLERATEGTGAPGAVRFAAGGGSPRRVDWRQPRRPG